MAEIGWAPDPALQAVSIPSAWSAGRLGPAGAILAGKNTEARRESIIRRCNRWRMGHLGVQKPAMGIGCAFSLSCLSSSVHLLLFAGKRPSLAVLLLAIPGVASLSLYRLIKGLLRWSRALLADKSPGGLLRRIKL